MNGNGVDSVSPHYQSWDNLHGNWAVRGGTGVTIATDGVGGGTSYFTNLGVGRYWKGADDALLRHHWLSLVANFNTPQSGSTRTPPTSASRRGIASRFTNAGSCSPASSSP